MNERKKADAGAIVVAAFAIVAVLMLNGVGGAAASPVTPAAHAIPSAHRAIHPLTSGWNPTEWYAGGRPDTNGNNTTIIEASLVTPDDQASYISTVAGVSVEPWNFTLMAVVPQVNGTVHPAPLDVLSVGFTTSATNGLFYPYASIKTVTGTGCANGHFGGASVTQVGTTSLRAYTAYKFVINELPFWNATGGYAYSIDFEVWTPTVNNPVEVFGAVLSDHGSGVKMGELDYSGTTVTCPGGTVNSGMYYTDIVEEVQNSSNAQEPYPIYSFTAQSMVWYNHYWVPAGQNGAGYWANAFQNDTMAYNTFTNYLYRSFNLTLSSSGGYTWPIFDQLTVANEKFGIIFCSGACTPWEPGSPGTVESLSNVTPLNNTVVYFTVVEYASSATNITHWCTPERPYWASRVQSNPWTNIYSTPRFGSHLNILDQSQTAGSVQFWILLETGPYGGASGNFNSQWTDFTEAEFTVTFT